MASTTDSNQNKNKNMMHLPSAEEVHRPDFEEGRYNIDKLWKTPKSFSDFTLDDVVSCIIIYSLMKIAISLLVILTFLFFLVQLALFDKVMALFYGADPNAHIGPLTDSFLAGFKGFLIGICSFVLGYL
jgi:hypothetical protein